MPADRDIVAFDARAERYEQGWLGRLHREIATRTAAIVLSSGPRPLRILDVGCGTGYLLRLLAAGCPDALELDGIDPAAAMIDVARRSTTDSRISFAVGRVEDLGCPDNRFDVVVTTTSFDHWGDQRAGVAQCARVLRAGGRLIIVDLFSRWLVPTLVGSRKEKARTRARAERLLTGLGLRPSAWHDVVPLISAVVARSSVSS